MPLQKEIPIHDFSRDTKDSVPFRFVQLGALTEYDYSRPHRHNYYEIFFFNKGGGEHLIDFKKYPIRDNGIHFISPGQVHCLRREEGSHGSIILFSRDFFHFGSEGSNTLYNFPFLNSGAYPVLDAATEEFAEFLPLLLQMQNESLKGVDVFAEILRSYLNIVLLKSLQLFNGRYPDHQMKQGTVFNKFRELVEKEYRGNRQPAYYASQLNITEKKLNEVCKENSGENVSDYIKDRVLLEAKRLLHNTDHNIKEIAYFLGFEDPSYFNRFFRVNTGVTAGDFRKEGN
ncbi:AraC family transcriptional regulator [Polluticoccus soli]|uniref:AraC family transcriptional regulator n=1 Tax=Polluticoccus soli TaxID=3034150 RepID=UPI0023E10C9B|nr:helix-turn-helix transcriptional regulator [Flavipsychrobacter sp. JY13-12]